MKRKTNGTEHVKKPKFWVARIDAELSEAIDKICAEQGLNNIKNQQVNRYLRIGLIAQGKLHAVIDGIPLTTR